MSLSSSSPYSRYGQKTYKTGCNKGITFSIRVVDRLEYASVRRTSDNFSISAASTRDQYAPQTSQGGVDVLLFFEGLLVLLLSRALEQSFTLAGVERDV